MTDFNDLVRQIAHLAGQKHIVAALRAEQRATNITRLIEAQATGAPTRLYADPLILAAECAATKARSRAKYGNKSHG